MVESQVDELGVLQQTMLRHARAAVLRVEFFRGVLSALLSFCRCDRVCIMLREAGDLDRWELDRSGADPFRFARVAWLPHDVGAARTCDNLCLAVMRGEPVPAASRTPRGSFVCDEGVEVIALMSEADCLGVLRLESLAGRALRGDGIGGLDAVGDALVVALVHHRVRWALRERVKELTCLYGISRAADRSDISLETAMQRIVELIPPGWQYPEITSAAVELDGKLVAVSGSLQGAASMSEDVVVHGIKRGLVRVVYGEERPPYDDGPFLREERSLMQEVARQVGLIIERRESEQETLRQADRLATIGRLAAGAAHELNEPLGSILGFAQLAKKHPRVPREVDRDLDRIVKASLHAREVIRQLMLFARQTPPQKRAVELNAVVREALALVRDRLERRTIRLVRRLASSLPSLVADPGQLQQVVINLVVNAVQAMPEGGALTVLTSKVHGGLRLVVEDTGVGMPEEIRSKIFMPFYTTKDAGLGTGLGLSVVHGIVTSHGGTIRVASEVGRGTRFEIMLPAQGGEASREDGGHEQGA
jgi:signal transduction histidine kinase